MDLNVRRLSLDGSVIQYRIQRSRRRKKTIQIWAHPDSGVVVTAPEHTPDQEVEDVVRRRGGWILKRLAEVVPAAAPVQFISGERLPYQGFELELVVKPMAGPAIKPASQASARPPEVWLEPGCLYIARPSLASPAEERQAVYAAVLNWYQARADAQIRSLVNHWWPALGRDAYPKIYIRNQRKRWGSCAHDGTLRFNWRLSMLRPALTEYVVVHELAHRTHMNHSPAFWNLVAEHLPDAPERRRILGEVGKTLPQL